MAAWGINDVTFWGFVFGPWIVLGIWELVLAYERSKWKGERERPQLISQVARVRGWQMNTIPYVWGAMAGHWWWNAAWDSSWKAYVFWAMIPVLLVWDIAQWHSDPATWGRVRRFFRRPLLWLVVGILIGRFFFPQAPVSWDVW